MVTTLRWRTAPPSQTHPCYPSKFLFSSLRMPLSFAIMEDASACSDNGLPESSKDLYDCKHPKSPYDSAFLGAPRVLPEPCVHRASLRVLFVPQVQCLNQSCPGLSLGCLCTTLLHWEGVASHYCWPLSKRWAPHLYLVQIGRSRVLVQRVCPKGALGVCHCNSFFAKPC